MVLYVLYSDSEINFRYRKCFIFKGILSNATYNNENLEIIYMSNKLTK